MKLKPSELADISNTSRANITQQVKRGSLLVGTDKKIDIDNPVNANWLAARGIGREKLIGFESEKKEIEKPKKEIGRKESQKKIDNKLNIKLPSGLNQYQPINQDEIDPLTGVPEHMAHLSLTQVVKQYGSIMGLKIHAEIVNKILATEKINIGNQEKRKTLVPIEFIEFLKSYVDVMMEQLYDFSESCIVDIIPMIMASPDDAKTKIPVYMRNEFYKMGEESKKLIDKEVKKFKRKKEIEQQAIIVSAVESNAL